MIKRKRFFVRIQTSFCLYIVHSCPSASGRLFRGLATRARGWARPRPLAIFHAQAHVLSAVCEKPDLLSGFRLLGTAFSVLVGPPPPPACGDVAAPPAEAGGGPIMAKSAFLCYLRLRSLGTQRTCGCVFLFSRFAPASPLGNQFVSPGFPPKREATYVRRDCIESGHLFERSTSGLVDYRGMQRQSRCPKFLAAGPELRYRKSG